MQNLATYNLQLTTQIRYGCVVKKFASLQLTTFNLQLKLIFNYFNS
ncbi:MAG: hypothetical protein JWP94_968 [Mucilaginibacter sp.]|nr:hypothetical protein [Mucilaginibacter sp.]